MLDERPLQGFLATRPIAVLATVQADGGPLAMPMWFVHDPATLTMISVADTQKVRNLRRDPRVCVVVESAGADGGDARGVTIRGRVTFLTDERERRALAERFHAKYPRLQRLWGGRAMPPTRVMFRIVPAHVTSWGLE